jgi:SAM-dependent methyltransferase
MEEGWRKYHTRWEGEHWFARAIEHMEFYSVFHRKLRDYLPPGSSVLDIGSGKGYSAFYFASLGYRVTGIDTDPLSVEEANAWAERLGLPARFLAADAFSFRPGKPFRLSYSMGLIEHFPPPEQVRLLDAQVALSEVVVALAPTSHSERTLPPCAVPWTPQTSGALRKTFARANLSIVDAFGVGDVYSAWDCRVKNILPHRLFAFLQNHFSYAMGVAVVGRSSAAP